MITGEKNVVECDLCGKTHKQFKTNRVRFSYLLDDTGLRMQLIQIDVCRECFGKHFRKMADEAVKKQSMRLQELAEKTKLIQKGEDDGQ